MDDAPSPARRALTVAVELPSRVLLSVVAAGVMTGLALGAASVWFSARFGAARRD